MNIFVLFYIIFYLIALFCYFFNRVSGNSRNHKINKLILSGNFMVFSLITCLLNDSLGNYQLIGLFAIISAFISDIILLFDFSKGGISFMITNTLFLFYQICLIINYNVSALIFLWFLLIFTLVYGSYLLLIKLRKINLNNYKKPFSAYLATVSLHGSLGLPLALSLIDNGWIFLFGIGSFLFMISDYLILTYKFILKDNKWIIRLNSATYFIGLLLASLSFL